MGGNRQPSKPNSSHETSSLYINTDQKCQIFQQKLKACVNCWCSAEYFCALCKTGSLIFRSVRVFRGPFATVCFPKLAPVKIPLPIAVKIGCRTVRVLTGTVRVDRETILQKAQ